MKESLKVNRKTIKLFMIERTHDIMIRVEESFNLGYINESQYNQRMNELEMAAL